MSAAEWLNRLDRRVRALSARRLFWTLIALDLALLLVLFVSIFVPREARLSIEAQTQIFDLSVPGGRGFDGWGNIKPTSIVSEEGVACPEPGLAMPQQLAGPFKMRAQLDRQGGLQIIFKDARPGALGELSCAGTTVQAPSYLVLGWETEAARGLALPFAGALVVGDQRTDMSTSRVLLNGTIYAQASSAPFPEGRVTSESRLYAGDRVVLTGKATGDGAIAHGLLRVDDGSIALTAHAVAREAEVTHIGQGRSEPEIIAPSFFAKLQAQWQWGLLLLAIAIFLHMLSALRDYLFERARSEEPHAPEV